MDFSKVYEGWKNKLFPEEKMKLIIEHASADRLKVCYGCDKCSIHHSTLRPDVHCMECGCTLSAKTACLSCECPLHKWKAIITSEQEQEIIRSHENDKKGTSV